MCGSTSQQNTLSNEQNDFYKQLTQEYSNSYGENQGILSHLTNSLQPILDAGPNQEGFGTQEKTALNTEATEGNAQNYAAASTALARQQAAKSGGGDFAPTGGDQQQSDILATAAAANQSNEQTQITQNDYATGRQNYDMAAQGMLGISSALNPTGLGSLASSSGASAASTANQIAADQNSTWNAALGALGGVASGLNVSNAGKVSFGAQG